MNLGIIGNYSLPRFGGVEVFSSNVAREMAALGHATTLLCAGGTDPRIIREGKLETRLLRSFNVAGMPIMPSLLRAIPKNVDLVHATMPSPLGALMALAWCRLHAKPLVVSVHSFPTRYGPLSRGYNGLILPSLLNFASLIIAPSRNFVLHSDLVSHFAQHESKVRFVPNGIDLRVFRPDKQSGSAMRQAYGLPKRTLLFVGVLDRAHWFKGLDVLLEAMKVILRRTETHLLVVGDGDNRRFYESLAEELGLSRNVTFAGKVSEDDLPKLYNASSCLVMPSVSHTESFGIVLAEAMACGVPVVASDVGGLSDTVGDAGLLIPPNDAKTLAETVTNLLGDSSLRSQVASRCLERARRRFSWTEIAKHHEELYYDLVERVAGAPSQTGPSDQTQERSK